MSSDVPDPADHRERWLLRLYVAGSAPKSLDAFANLKEICEQYLPGRYDIEIIDLIEHPTMAADDNILAVPTLVRLRPGPVRHLIGNLSDTERMLGYLRVPGRVTS